MSLFQGILSTLAASDQPKPCHFQLTAFILALLYTITLIHVISYVRKLLKNRNEEKTMQKIFLAFLILSCILRIIYFSAWAGDPSRKNRCISFVHKRTAWTNYLSSLPATLFMTGSTVLVYTFSSLYHSIILNNSTFHVSRHVVLSAVLILLNVTLYALTLGNYVRYAQNSPSKIMQEVYVFVLTAAVTLSASMFLVYGLLLFNYVEGLLRPPQDDEAGMAETEVDHGEDLEDEASSSAYVNPEIYQQEEHIRPYHHRVQRRNSLSPGYVYGSGVVTTMSPMHKPQLPLSPRGNGSRALDRGNGSRILDGGKSSAAFLPVSQPAAVNLEPLMVSPESLANMQVTIDMNSSMLPPELEGTAKLVHDSETHSDVSGGAVSNLFAQPNQQIFPNVVESPLLMDPLKDVEIEQVALAQLPLAELDEDHSNNLFRDNSRQWSQGSFKQNGFRSPTLKGEHSFGSSSRYHHGPGSPTTPVRNSSAHMIMGSDSRRSSNKPRQKSQHPHLSPRHEARMKQFNQNSPKAESSSLSRKDKTSPAFRRRSGTNVDITPLIVSAEEEAKPQNNENGYGTIARSSNGSEDLFAHSEHESVDSGEMRMRLPNPMLKILKLGVICGACMVIRIVLLIVMNTLFDEKPPFITGVYYILTEFLPSNAMILVLDTPTTQVALGKATLTSAAHPSDLVDAETWKSHSQGSVASVDLSDVPSI